MTSSANTPAPLSRLSSSTRRTDLPLPKRAAGDSGFIVLFTACWSGSSRKQATGPVNSTIAHVERRRRNGRASVNLRSGSEHDERAVAMAKRPPAFGEQAELAAEVMCLVGAGQQGQ